MMNVTKLIAQLKKSRKLLPVTAFHFSVNAAVQLSKDDFTNVIPFLKTLFKTLDKHGFDVLITRWGEIYLYSCTRKIEIELQLTEPSLREIQHNTDYRMMESYGYQLVDVKRTTPNLVVRFFFVGTRSKWRTVNVDINAQELESQAENITMQILKHGGRFEGRVSSQVHSADAPLSQYDLAAFSQFAVNTTSNVRAWKGIFKATQHYIHSFEISENHITIESTFPNRTDTFHWHKNDLTFIRRYLPHFPRGYT